MIMTIKDERDQDPASKTSGALQGIKIECDSRMRIIAVSHSFSLLTGRQAANCEGMKMLGLVRPADHEVFTLFFDQALLRRDSWSEGTFAVTTEEGALVWFEGRAQALRDRDNNTRIILSLNDVTARKTLQDELTQTKSVLLAITEQTKTGYVLIGTDLNIITFNESAETRFLMQFRKPPLAGVSMLEYMQEERKADMRELYLDTLAGKSSSFHISFPGPDGKVRWYLGHVFPV